VQSRISISGLEFGYNFVSAWRMANSGTGPKARNMTLGVDYLPYPGTPFYMGGIAYWLGTDDGYRYSHLAYDDDHPYGPDTGSARCGTYAGIYGGQLDNPPTITVGVPAYWDAAGNYNFVLDSAHPSWSGLFWDVCDDGSGNDWFVGYYTNPLTGNQPAVWTSARGADNPVFPTTGTFSGGEARGINANQDVGGQVFGSSGNPPAVWTYQGSYAWNLTDVSTSSDWPSGRDGYVVGLTDRDGANGPYAVGYMTATPGNDDGQPFIYSVGTGRVRFCGTQYSAPTQITNQSYDTGDVIVSFCGNNANYAPYIWMGSPDPTKPYSGVADDIYAFLDPDVSFATAPTISGINSTFHFGGSCTAAGVLEPWMSDDKAENWQFGSEPAYTFPVGYLKSMANADDMRSANGKFATVVGSDTSGLEVDALWTVPSGPPSPTEVAFRTTNRLETNFTNSYAIDFYDWKHSTWVSQVTTTMPTYWQTKVASFAVKGSLFVNNSNQVLARVKVTGTSAASIYWNVDIDQAVFLWK